MKAVTCKRSRCSLDGTNSSRSATLWSNWDPSPRLSSVGDVRHERPSLVPYAGRFDGCNALTHPENSFTEPITIFEQLSRSPAVHMDCDIPGVVEGIQAVTVVMALRNELATQSAWTGLVRPTC